MIRKTYPVILGLAGLLVLATILAGTLPPPDSNAVPQTISLQGRFTDSGGDPVSAPAGSGPVTGTVSIKIFAGVASVLIAPIVVAGVTFDSTGIFNVAFPLPENINLSATSHDLEITVTLTNPSQSAITLPRQPMSSAPMALVAQKIQTPVGGMATGPVVNAVLSGTGNAIYAQSNGLFSTLRAQNNGAGRSIYAFKNTEGTALGVSSTLAANDDSAVVIESSSSTASALLVKSAGTGPLLTLQTADVDKVTVDNSGSITAAKFMTTNALNPGAGGIGVNATGAAGFGVRSKFSGTGGGTLYGGDYTGASPGYFINLSDGDYNFQVHTDGDIFTTGVLFLKGNGIFLNHDGPDGDSTIGFYEGGLPTGAFFNWQNTYERFYMSRDLYVAGDLTSHTVHAEATGAGVEGVYGHSTGTGSAYGVYGESANSHGVVGRSSAGYGGYFIGSRPSDHVARFKNESTGTTADGIEIEIGPNSSPGAGNNFISFLDGNGTLVGQIEGNGDGGISYVTHGNDFAEYFAAEEDIPTGYLVGLNEESGKVRNWKLGDHFIGIISTSPGFVGNDNSEGGALVALVGQVEIKDLHSVVFEQRVVKTKDGQKIGYLLANGKVLISRN